jgi:hypothetical protein
MGNMRYTNNASATLAAGIASGDTSLTVSSGQGSAFPTLSGSQYAKITCEDVGGNIEIMHMTARGGDVLTVLRAQEGTTALAFASGSRVELRVTAGALSEFLQRTEDNLSGVYNCTGGVFTGASNRDGEVVNSPIRGETGVTSNQLVVPPGGGAPTIGGSVIYTAANLTQAAVNTLTFKVGTIMMWYGAIGLAPTGWQICDGTNGTPDQRVKVVVGAGGAYTLGATGGAASVTSGAGGAHTPVITGTALTTAHLPPHGHTIYGQSSGGAGDTESFAGGAAIAGNTDGSKAYINANGASTVLIGLTGDGDTHTHGASAVADHTHSVATVPPYVALFFIMKV